MARRQNVKRIDPRYFLNETVNRNDDGPVLDENEKAQEHCSREAKTRQEYEECMQFSRSGQAWQESQELEEEAQPPPVHHYIAQGQGLKDMHGDILVKRGGSFAVQKNQQGRIKVGVRHGTGTESWFDRPVDAQELDNHHPNPGYRPPPPQGR